MAIGSDPEIGRSFKSGVPKRPEDYGPWVMPDGSVVELMRGEATTCFIGGRPGNIYPPQHHHFVIVEPQEILCEYDDDDVQSSSSADVER